MSQVLFYALGGLEEDGKNLYCVEVDKKIYILDAGSKTPSLDLHGVDLIVPNISYLIENKRRVAGLFLTHAHDEHIGSVYQLIKEINPMIYGSRFTMEVLKDKLQKDGINFDPARLITVKSRSTLEINNLKIRFFELTHNIPDCCGIDILTDDGNIIYTGNYNFDQNASVDYAAMFRNLAVFSKEKVLLLLSESLGATNASNRGTILEFKTRMNSILTSSEGRVIFSLYSSDILRIQQIINIAIDNHKKVALLGKKTQRLLAKAIELGYLHIPEQYNVNLRYIDEQNDNNDKDLVILVTGERHEPFFMLQRMSKRIDRLVHMEKTDTIVVLTNPVLGTEKMSARTLDIIYKVTSKVYTFKDELLPPVNASREEIKEMINILKPKYIIPVVGEYRHLYALGVVANCIGYNNHNTIILDLGDVAEFNNGQYVGITKSVPFGEVLLDGKAFGNIGDVVMHDRELLANDGVLIISSNVNPKTKKILTGPDIVSKGFMYDNQDLNLFDKIKQTFIDTANGYLQEKFINWSEFKTELRGTIASLIYKETRRSPIIIPVLISTDYEESLD